MRLQHSKHDMEGHLACMQRRIAPTAVGGKRTNEDDGGRQLIGHPEQLADQLGPIAQVLLDELGTNHAQEGCAGAVGDRLGQQRLACARLPVQNDSLQAQKKKEAYGIHHFSH